VESFKNIQRGVGRGRGWEGWGRGPDGSLGQGALRNPNENMGVTEQLFSMYHRPSSLSVTISTVQFRQGKKYELFIINSQL
jgi:hypothetical protein